VVGAAFDYKSAERKEDRICAKRRHKTFHTQSALLSVSDLFLEAPGLEGTEQGRRSDGAKPYTLNSKQSREGEVMELNPIP